MNRKVTVLPTDTNPHPLSLQHTHNTPIRQCWKKTIITVGKEKKLFSWSVKLNSAILVYSQQYILFSVLILHTADASQVYVDPFVSRSDWTNTASFLFILCFFAMICWLSLVLVSHRLTHMMCSKQKGWQTENKGEGKSNAEDKTPQQW